RGTDDTLADRGHRPRHRAEARTARHGPRGPSALGHAPAPFDCARRGDGAVSLGIAVGAALPAPAGGGRVHWATLRPLLRFSGGMAGTMLLGHALNSLDQVILSALLPLGEFGYS